MSEPIVSKDGSPFKTLTAAKVAFTKLGLSVDEYAVEEVEDSGGFRIIKRDGSIAEPVVVGADGKIKMGDYPVIMIAPGGKGELKKVPIGVGGVVLNVERGKQVCIPFTYVDVLDHTIEVIYPEVDEGEEAEPYKRPRYSYTFIRNGTRAEFERMIKEGASMK